MAFQSSVNVFTSIIELQGGGYCIPVCPFYFAS